MIKFTYFTSLSIFILFSAFSAQAQEIDSDRILDTTLSNIARKNPEQFQGLHLDISKRDSIFTGCWIRATQASPVSDRAYCYALGIDIYNSISPDLQPELDELGPDEDVYEPNLRPVKKQFYDDVAYIDGNRPSADDEPSIEIMMLDLQDFKDEELDRFGENSIEYITRMRAYMESVYLDQHIRAQVLQGNILIDAPDAPATIDASQINLYNPTYYAQLKEYMDSVRPRIDALIPPWEE